MNNIILSAHKKPFKLERHALNAIKDKPGYVVEERKDGFVGVFIDLDEKIKQVDQIFIANANTIKEYQKAVIDRINQGRTKDVEGFSSFPLDVLCPSCGLSHNSTTKEYNHKIDANPAMLRLKPKYASYGWDELPADASMGYGCLECPECGSALAPDGRLKVDL